MDKYFIDLSDAENYFDVHKIIKKELKFPDYYGENLDALYDCLTDMLGDFSYIEIRGYEYAERKFGGFWREIEGIFKKAKYAYGGTFANRFNVVLIGDDGSKMELGEANP